MTTRDYTDPRDFESAPETPDNEYTDPSDFEERPEGSDLSAMQVAYRDMKAEVPWLNWRMFKIYMDAMVESDDSGQAWTAVRASDVYAEKFAGNVRKDGTLRYSEDDYMRLIESYKDTLRSTGVRVSLFRDEFAKLIEGNVDDVEFRQRVYSLQDRVLLASDDIRAEYAELWDLEMTNAGILASLFNPALEGPLLERRISMAEVGGEAAESGFDLRRRFVRDLVSADMTKAQADALFGEAQNMLPILNVLGRRHADPDDDFDIEEFTSASFFDDPEQRRRIRRLLNQERAAFQEGGGITIARDRAGGLAGLEAR
jgi:hypothetical protein